MELLMSPNKSLEPTAVTRGSCPRDRGLFHIVSRRWLSFFRYAAYIHSSG
jgi:hypothetical protein